MSKIFSTVSLATLLVVLFAPVAQASENIDDVTYGVHPWDVRPRVVYTTSDRDGELRYGVSKYFFYSHPDRSQTHALHPYFRETYYAPPIDTDAVRYSMFYRSNNGVRYSLENGYVPRPYKTAGCDNYSYGRANYRVSPYEYECQ
ncbi:MAG: hypothetical protein WCX61_00800 [Candidatus Peribacteraceae bacterium]|jgi:hypothetical protein